MREYKMLRNSISIRESIEGPRHDPYGVTTIDFKKSDDHVITLRQGSLTGDTLYLNGVEISKSLKDDDKTTVHLFENMTGFSCRDAERFKWEADVRHTMRKNNLNRFDAIDLNSEINRIDSPSFYI